MAAFVHLVRHAEVDNPQHLVLGSSSGFGLSPHGVDQARRVGRYLGPRPVVAIWSSPLEQALRTADEIASRSGIPVRVDRALTEWSIFSRWEGHPWASLEARFPEEIARYLDQPDSPEWDESLHRLADRVAAVARRLDSEHPHGDVVIVSHQDPVQGARLRLTGRGLDGVHVDKPGHGAVITLRPGPSWREETHWEPGDTPGFGDRSDLRVVPTGPHQPTSA